MLSDRPSWHEVWMRTALSVAERSLCSRAQIGAVIVTSDNRVNSVSYNGPAPGFRHLGKTCEKWCPRAQPGALTTADYSACPSVHAEANALVRAEFSAIALGTIYVSGAVCMNCAKLIAASGLNKVIHRVSDDDAHREPEKVEEYLMEMGVQVGRSLI